ncbi:MAG: hypothetical protein AB1341_08145 [Bacillota bacterium]
MRILLAAGATGNVDVNEGLKKILQENNLEVVGDCYSVDVLVNVTQQLSADTVIISTLLGEQDILVESIKNLRERGIRVIALPGDIEYEETRQFVTEIIPYGVYDLVFDEVKPEMILHRLQSPAALGDIPDFLVEAAMSKQQLSREIAVHAEKAVAEAEMLKKDKAKGLKLNFLNTLINFHNNAENKKAYPKNKASWHERFIKPKKIEAQINGSDINNTVEITDIIATKTTVKDSKLTTFIKTTPTVTLGLGNQNLNECLEHRTETVEHEEYRPKVSKFRLKKNIRDNNHKESITFSKSVNNIKTMVTDTVAKNLEKLNPVKKRLVDYGNTPKKESTSMVITVWNPLGTLKSFTALNLAIATKNSGLINFDLTCPELDIWFGIKQTKISEASEKDAGILTMGESMNPALVPKMLREIKWGVRYLSAGNKMGNIGTPDYCTGGINLFKEIIQKAREEVKIIIMDAGRDFEYPSTFAALSEADIILIPMLGLPQEADIISQQLTELKRVNVVKPTIELLYVTEDGYEKALQICDRRIEININFPQIIKTSMQKLPHCLNEGRDVWNYISAQINL